MPTEKELAASGYFGFHEPITNAATAFGPIAPPKKAPAPKKAPKKAAKKAPKRVGKKK